MSTEEFQKCFADEQLKKKTFVAEFKINFLQTADVVTTSEITSLYAGISENALVLDKIMFMYKVRNMSEASDKPLAADNQQERPTLEQAGDILDSMTGLIDSLGHKITSGDQEKVLETIELLSQGFAQVRVIFEAGAISNFVESGGFNALFEMKK